MLLVAIAATEHEGAPYLNQIQLARLVKKATGTVSDSLALLCKHRFCRKLNAAERMRRGIGIDKRRNYHEVTPEGITALLEYETIRSAFPPPIAHKLLALPEYNVVVEHLRKSISSELSRMITEAGTE